jgi:hypothetical protein
MTFTSLPDSPVELEQAFHRRRAETADAAALTQ